MSDTTKNELIIALEKYIVLLGEEIDELVGMAYVHGWRSTRFEEGKRQRKEISDLKEIDLN